MTYKDKFKALVGGTVIGCVCKECNRVKHDLYQEKNKDKIYKPGELIKAPVTDGVLTEHMWFEVIDVTKDILTCALSSEPQIVHNVRYGSLVTVRRDTIEEDMPKGLSEEELYKHLFKVYNEVKQVVQNNPHKHG